jgi:hypothetical protein
MEAPSLPVGAGGCSSRQETGDSVVTAISTVALSFHERAGKMEESRPCNESAVGPNVSVPVLTHMDLVHLLARAKSRHTGRKPSTR